jgi:light-regulated signal transduction histidine kinase (bacteriophytochrome)
MPEQPYEMPILTKHGERRWLDVSPTQINYNGAPAYIGIAADITERKRAEQELHKVAKELTRSNRDLEQFAYVASHDLREPLRMITAYLDLLKRRYGNALDDDAREFIDFSVNGALRMQDLINDLLAYSRAGARTVPFEQVSMEWVMDDVLMDLSQAIAANDAEVTYDLLPVVYGAKSQIRQVMMNLISNAIKFRREEPPKVHISARRVDGQWLISVRDNGIGFSQEQADRVFELFQRLHPRQDYAGTGLGLAICKKIVERHGGAIWVESQPEMGSTFYFTLPEKGD